MLIGVLILIGQFLGAVRYNMVFTDPAFFYCHHFDLLEGCPWLERPPTGAESYINKNILTLTIDNLGRS